MADLQQLVSDFANSLRILGVPAAAEPGQAHTIGLLPSATPVTISEVVDHAITLTGGLTGVVPVTELSQFQPKVEVQWFVKEGGTDLEPDIHYLAPDGLNQLILNLVHLPKFAAASLEVPPPVTRTISAQVTVTLGTASATVPVPPVTTILPTIPFPRMLVLAKDLQFGGPVLVLLPGGTYVHAIQTLKTLLKRVQSVLSLVTGVAKFAATLAGVGAILDMLESPHLAIATGDKFNNLNDFDLIYRPWYTSLNDTEAEDELSSFVYLAPPGEYSRGEPPEYTVDMFVARNCDPSEGWFRVNAGLSIVAVSRSMHGPIPDMFPIFPDIPMVGRDPFSAGVIVLQSESHDNFGNKLSSIQFN